MGNPEKSFPSIAHGTMVAIVHHTRSAEELMSSMLESAKRISLEAVASKEDLIYDPEICAYTARNAPSADELGLQLFTAAEQGGVESLRRLIDLRAEPDWKGQHGRTPLLAACKNGHAKCAVLLLEAGADPNLANVQGVGPVHVAAASGHLECLRALRSARADMLKRDGSGVTALEWAKRTKQKEAVKLLSSPWSVVTC